MGPKSEKKLIISFGKLVNESAGGLVVRLTDKVTGTFKEHKLETPPYVLAIPDGDWLFDVVVFPGPGAWSGVPSCGSSAQLLSSTTDAVNITVGNDCTPIPYPTLIASLSGTWDESSWDQANWGP